MRQRSSPAFREQRARFRLRFTCEHCSYFHVETERCTHGYPNAAHREARHPLQLLDAEAPPDELLFCKEFELM